jgi:hypothetical protein
MTQPRIATSEQIDKIRVMILTVIADFYNTMNRAIKSNEFSMVAMYATDAAYNLRVLSTFLDNHDLAALRNGLYHQDTAPRECFGEVFDFIDEAE